MCQIYNMFFILGIRFLFSCKSKIECLDSLSINTTIVCCVAHRRNCSLVICPTFEISRTMYLKGYKSYTVDPGVMLTSLVRLHCILHTQTYYTELCCMFV